MLLFFHHQHIKASYKMNLKLKYNLIMMFFESLYILDTKRDDLNNHWLIASYFYAL